MQPVMSPEQASTLQVMTFDEIFQLLGYLTEEQVSLAHSPEPAFESLGGSDCRRGGSCGLDLNGDTRRSRWVRARVRWNKEQKKLTETTCQRCRQLIAFDGEEWRTTEWPKGFTSCPTISRPKHVPSVVKFGGAA